MYQSKTTIGEHYKKGQPNNGQETFFRPPIQPKLTINEPGDEFEQEADAVADKVMRSELSAFPPTQKPFFMPPVIQRKCAHCAEEEKVQSKPSDGVYHSVSNSGNGQTLNGQAAEAIQRSRGKGEALPGSVKNWMESRFDTNFSNVRIHRGDNSSLLAQTMDAQAFTIGNDIFFNEGNYQPNSFEGKHLLAHELVHTVQQKDSYQSHINRKLTVTSPSKKIPNPTGKGKVQTNNDTVLDYLKMLCASGNVTISPAGEVSIPSYFCSETPYPPDFIGPKPITVSGSATPVGCGCLCDLVASSNVWRITVDDSSWPHTVFDDTTKALTSGSGGSGGEVTAPSPNSPTLWGAVTAPGAFMDIDPWLVLGHELCGHAWLGNKGDAGLDETKPRGRGGHQATVGRENLIRDEHSITRRGTHRQPYCGESFMHPLGTAATAKSVSLSGSVAVCEKWRKEYNLLNGTSFTIRDAIPVKPGEKLPP